MNKITTILNQPHEKKIRLMTHMVIGFPTLEKSGEVLDALLESGSSFIELQIPFSDPLADGPTIMNACDQALRNNVTFAQCLDSIRLHPSPQDKAYILVCYANLPYEYGIERFVKEVKQAGVSGILIPDLPFDSPEGKEFLRYAEKNDFLWIPIVTQETTKERLEKMAAIINPPLEKEVVDRTDRGFGGFMYCTAYSGVTGGGNSVHLEYLEHARRILNLPIAVGFGIRTKEQIESLTGKADLAVVGSAIIDVVNLDGENICENVREFLGSIY